LGAGLAGLANSLPLRETEPTMPLMGRAAIVIWNDVAEGQTDDFVAWHNREHIAERVGIEGFRRGRRGRAVAGGPRFLTLYEVEDVGVLDGEAYLARLNAPSAWTQRVLPQFRNTARSLCRVETSIGAGVGGALATLRWAEEAELGGDRLEWFNVAVRDMLAAQGELTGVHLLRRESGASGQDMAERRLRTEDVAMPATVLIVEAGTVETAIEASEALAGRLHAIGVIAKDGAVDSTYRHEFCLTAPEAEQ
jgi:hypothetical protein